MKKLERGIYGIPLTPFRENGEIDYTQLERETDFIVRAGAHGVAGPLIASSFMELSDEERLLFMKTVVATVDGRVPVVVNISGLYAGQAVRYANFAEAIGADAVIALPPYLRRIAGEELYEYYGTIAKACSLPVVIQNSVDIVGTPVPTSMLCRLAADFDNIRYVKEERVPAAHLISEVSKQCGVNIDGVFGGFGGKNLIQELKRGMYGTMVACDVVDIQVKIFELFQLGRIQEATCLHEKLLPFLNMKSGLGGDSVSKEILRRRGVLKDVILRVNRDRMMDALDHEELDQYMQTLSPYFSV